MDDALAIRERLKTQPTPLIDANTATFVWLGETAPRLAGDFTDWERGQPVALTQVGPGVWAYQLKLPADAYIEYAFMQGEERQPDPLNPRRTPNGIGDTNQYFYMPAGKPCELARHRPHIRRGALITQAVKTEGLAAGSTRKVHLYQPAVNEPCPLVVVWDGRDYLRRARLPAIVDNLAAQGRIRPVALALVHNGGAARMLEYSCCEATLLFLHECVLPLARAHLNLVDIAEQPSAYGVLGASMGGLMALFTALQLPRIFGKVLSQSGAFRLGRYTTTVYRLAAETSAPPVKVWMDAGLYDFQYLLTANRDMHRLLTQRGYPVAYREYPAGHNYPAWRDEVWRGLEWLFPA